MPFTGRYHLVRNFWLPTQELSAPYVLDRRDLRLRPYLGNGAARAEHGPKRDRIEASAAWERKKAKIAAQPTARQQLRLAERLLARDADMSRLAALFDKNELFPMRLLLEVALGSFTTIAFNNNYVSGTSGNAIAARYLVPVGGKTINSVYFFISSITGTAANVDDINLELRPEASAGAATPATGTLTESKTHNPSSTTGWRAVTGWTSVLTALSRVFFIVGDADGGGTDFATVNAVASLMDSSVSLQSETRFMSARTTGGFNTGNTASVNPGAMVRQLAILSL